MREGSQSYCTGWHPDPWRPRRQSPSALWATVTSGVGWAGALGQSRRASQTPAVLVHLYKVAAVTNGRWAGALWSSLRDFSDSVGHLGVRGRKRQHGRI